MEYLGSTNNGKMTSIKNAELAKYAGKRAIDQVTRLVKRLIPRCHLESVDYKISSSFYVQSGCLLSTIHI